MSSDLMPLGLTDPDALVVNDYNWIQSANNKPFVNPRMSRHADIVNCLATIKSSTVTDTQQNPSYICDLVNDKSSHQCGKAIDIKNRIGSASGNGVVYKFGCGGPDLVLKIMPIRRAKAKTENAHEIEVATELSELVKRGESKYFPIVYGHDSCANVKLENLDYIESYKLDLQIDHFKKICKIAAKLGILPSEVELTDHLDIDDMSPNSTVNIKLDSAILQQGAEYIFDDLDVTVDVTATDGHNGVWETLTSYRKDNVQVALNNVLGKNYLDQSAITLGADILYSEMANMDVRQFVADKTVFTSADLLNMIKQIIAGLTDLQKNCMFIMIFILEMCWYYNQTA